MSKSSKPQDVVSVKSKKSISRYIKGHADGLMKKL